MAEMIDWDKYRIMEGGTIDLIKTYRAEIAQGHVLAESILKAIETMQPITSPEVAGVAIANANISELFWVSNMADDEGGRIAGSA